MVPRGLGPAAQALHMASAEIPIWHSSLWLWDGLVRSRQRPPPPPAAHSMAGQETTCSDAALLLLHHGSWSRVFSQPNPPC